MEGYLILNRFIYEEIVTGFIIGKIDIYTKCTSYILAMFAEIFSEPLFDQGTTNTY